MAAMWSSDQKIQIYNTSGNQFQKFLNMINGHEKTDFFILTTFFAPVIFLIREILKSDQKMAGAKKVVTMKSQFFHIHQPCEGIL